MVGRVKIVGLSHPNIDEISHENALSDVAILHGIGLSI